MDIEDDEKEPSSKILKKNENLENEKLSAELKSKDDQIKMLQSTLQVKGSFLYILNKVICAIQGMQKQLLEAQRKSGMLPSFLRDKTKEEPKKKPQSFGVIDLASDDEDEVQESNKSSEDNTDQVEACVNPDSLQEEAKSELKESPEKLDDVRVVMLTSMFLHIHPGGAELKEISEYLKKVEVKSDLNEEQLKNILVKYPNCFVSDSESNCDLVKWKIFNY